MHFVDTYDQTHTVVTTMVTLTVTKQEIEAISSLLEREMIVRTDSIDAHYRALNQLRKEFAELLRLIP